MRSSASTGSSTSDAGSLLLDLLGAVALAFPLLMAAQVLQHGAIAGIVDDYLRGRRDISLKRAYKRLFERAGTAIGVAVLYGLLLFTGLCFLFGVGALVFLISYAFVGQMLVVERRGLIDCFKRSRLLTLPFQGKVFGLLFVSFLLSLLISGGIAAVISVLFELTPTIKGVDAATQTYQQEMISSALEAVAQLLIAPFGGVALSLLYYDLRVRQEGFDMVTQAEESGVTLAPDPFGDLPSQQAAARDRKVRLKAERKAAKK
jgi:hypothetical protein